MHGIWANVRVHPTAGRMPSVNSETKKARPAGRVERIVRCSFYFLSHKYQATIWVSDVKFGHSIRLIKQVSGFVAVLQGLHVLQKRVNTIYLNIDFSMASNRFHDALAGGFHEMNTCSISLHD